MSTSQADRAVDVRAGWRSVAIPSEHGGWGLTLEPVLLGLLVAWSSAGVALGIAAFTAFLVRTPAKLVAVDLRRRRWLDRSRIALDIAAVEMVVLCAAVGAAILLAGWSWLVPVLVAAPLVAVEMSFETRSRARKLVPELCGAIAVAAVSASIVVAAGRDAVLVAGVWLVLAARVVGAIPFVRVQILRLRRGDGPVWQSDLAQVCAVALGVVAVIVDRRLLPALAAIVVLAGAQSLWVRRAPIAAKQLGLRQMAIGLALVAVAAAGVLW